MGSYLEDLDGHEGYGTRRLPDGTLTATWSTATARFDAYVAACSCGWVGGEHPVDDDGYDAAVGEWETEHARPLLAVTLPAEVADTVKAAKDALARLTTERPAAARRALDDTGRWADTLRTIVDAQRAVPEHDRADRPMRQPPRRRPLGR